MRHIRPDCCARTDIARLRVHVLVASSTILAERLKVSIKGLRRMDVRRGPMHNDRDLHGLAVTRS